MSHHKTRSSTGGGLSELRRRLLFVLFAVVLYRLGSYVPIPGLDLQRLTDLFTQHNNSGLLGMLNMFSGGALGHMTVFAMGIMPYISASIVIQLYSQVSQRLQRIKKEGEVGRKKINQYIRYGTLILSIIQAAFMSRWLVASGVVLNPGFSFYFISDMTLVSGTLFLMWLGEQITERGIGNGISLIIFFGIVSRFPSAIGQIFTQLHQGQMKAIVVLFLLLVVVLITFCVVFMERAQRKILVNYAVRQQGFRPYTASNNHLPLKINMAGVVPVIFAQSLILFPGTIATFLAKIFHYNWLNTFSLSLQFGQPLYIVLFSCAVIFFSFFYTALVFNPKETAENLKKSGAFIAGVRPGAQTAQYIDKIMTRLTLIGSLYLTAVALIPQFLTIAWDVPFYFGGTSLLIVVVVVMDFMAQIQAYFMGHRYDNLMKKTWSKQTRST